MWNIDIFLLLFANCLYIYGIYTVTDYKLDDKGQPCEKMALWKLSYWSEKYLGAWWSKPLFLCPTCMASVHGAYFYFIFSEKNILLFPFYIVILAAINYFVQRYYE